MKFTKGPWLVNKEPHLKGRIIQTHDYATMVCEVETIRPCNKENLEEQRANAHLIASAPEMYEALENLTRIFNPDKQSSYNFAKKDIESALSVLKKARGE